MSESKKDTFFRIVRISFMVLVMIVLIFLSFP